MQFLKWDLGQSWAGEIVGITLWGTAANVRLMDSTNLRGFEAGRRHNYYGGYVRESVRLQVPRADHWHVVVYLGEYSGRVSASVEVLPGRLPPLRERPLSDVPSFVRDPIDPGKQDDAGFEVFVLYASEDKDEVVRPLAHSLEDQGLSVWFDEFELKIGDNLRRKTDRGLARSRFGVVVLSHWFFDWGWTKHELDELVTRAVTEEQVLLPIWYGITKQDLIDYSPSLVDKLARSTATHTVEEIAEEIASVIHSGSTGFSTT